MADVARIAVERSTKEAIGFARDHPAYATLIALGVLAILTPWVIEALGFSELGPVEGSFAAAWQRLYAGFVPKGSLFSFFQRLGMWIRSTRDGESPYFCITVCCLASIGVF